MAAVGVEVEVGECLLNLDFLSISSLGNCLTRGQRRSLKMRENLLIFIMINIQRLTQRHILTHSRHTDRH